MKETDEFLAFMVSMAKREYTSIAVNQIETILTILLLTAHYPNFAGRLCEDIMTTIPEAEKYKEGLDLIMNSIGVTS